MTIRRKILEDGFMLVVLFLATGAFQSLVVDPTYQRDGADGSPFMQLIWFLVYAVVVVRLIPHYRQITMLIRANKSLVLLVLLAVLSVIWSEDPAMTLRKSVPLLATTLIGIDFAVRYPVRDQLRLLLTCLGLVVLLGIVAQLFFPSLIPSGDFDSDAWHGVVAFKNDWARIVVLTMVALLCWSRRSLRAYLFIGFLTLVGLGLIIAAHSIGALIILIAMLLLSKMIGALRWRPRILVVASIASALMLLSTSYLIVQNIDKATAVLGRDSSLTGRVDIWKIALSSILENPIHGYGYRAFWSANSQAAMTLREEFNWAINHSHNGYIELTLDLGLAGLLLLIFSYLIAGRRAIVYFRRGIGREAMWPVTYLSFFFLYQFTEGSLVSGNTIFWIVYVALCLSVTEISGTHQRVPQSESKGTVLIQALPFDRQQA